MNREYTREDYLRRVERLRQAIPDVALTTDLIVGFPGESEADFIQTLGAVEEIGFDQAYTFKYSKRPNTPALHLDGHLPEEIKTERLQRLMTVQREITASKNRSEVGKVVELLIEGRSKTNPCRLTGRTRANRVVNFDGPSDLIGSLVSAKIVRARGNSLDGEII
jgi:tRNA-2-methylthio-N6-dimethylallyladenosine synthase